MIPRPSHFYWNTVKTVLSGHSKIDKTKILLTNGSLMKVESIAECWSILQYFWPALSDNWSWKPIFGLLFEWPLKTGFTVPVLAEDHSHVHSGPSVSGAWTQAHRKGMLQHRHLILGLPRDAVSGCGWEYCLTSYVSSASHDSISQSGTEVEECSVNDFIKDSSMFFKDICFWKILIHM